MNSMKTYTPSDIVELPSADQLDLLKDHLDFFTEAVVTNHKFINDGETVLLQICNGDWIEINKQNTKV